ncbi:MAG: translation factor Sua5 [Kiritimatiellaceae bacterium]|nr:translation factor Sua5 [Kiritimatiellaceae bacterium]RZO85926.1 MAG: Sua5/YciO/YrdC/YwlC family protein [Kiritimatiellaceae bacterium]|tara:strand:+ start:3425 stop:4036 length:612 start_codon:yes stop_codon:yes gene_type:complete
MSSHLKIDPQHPAPDAITRAAQLLAEGGLLILPTETVYGIACDPQQPQALQRLQAAKGRDANKPIARLVATPQQVKPLALHWNNGIQALCQAHWPGPLTLVLETAHGWTGFRVPDHPVPIAIATAYGSALALTSANLSGQPDPRTAQQTHDLPADLTLDSGPTADQAIPSTVIKIDRQTIELLRAGALPFPALESLFHQGLST